MVLIAKLLTGVVALIHVYIVVLEMILFRARGPKVFGVAPEHVEVLAPAMSNQGLYNGFLVAALALGLFLSDPALSTAFTRFGLICVIVAGIWGAITVNPRILAVQAVPAVLALAAHFWAGRA
jgi:putative membrane protein